MMNDATCRFSQPVVGRETASPLGIVVRSDPEDRERRCLFTRTSMGEERLAIGQAATDMYRLRIRSNEIEPQVGWRVEIRADGESEWHGYVVTRVSKRLMWDLILRRVADGD